MGLFTKKLTEEELTAKIEDLKAQHENLKAEHTATNRAHAEALATGADLTVTKKRLAELAADLENIPAAITMLEEELDHVRADSKVAVIAGISKIHRKADR